LEGIKSAAVSEIAAAWDRGSASYQAAARLPTDVANYGPGLPTEAELRLLGDVKGKRVLELGCGGAQSSIAFAKQGATAIGVDFSAAQLEYARSLCEQEEVRVELRLGDMADLAFLRADTIDIAFSTFSFGYVEDLNRVFRQVHRVLKVGAPLVFSLPHPAARVVAGAGSGAVGGPRSYFDDRPYESTWGGVRSPAYHHTFADLYMGLSRSSYRVDLVLEPEPAAGSGAASLVPTALIMRARKEGN
jgi:SAM-dependent methyltransferase